MLGIDVALETLISALLIIFRLWNAGNTVINGGIRVSNYLLVVLGAAQLRLVLVQGLIIQRIIDVQVFGNVVLLALILQLDRLSQCPLLLVDLEGALEYLAQRGVAATALLRRCAHMILIFMALVLV